VGTDNGRERDLAEALVDLVADARREASIAEKSGSIGSDLWSERVADPSAGAMLAAKLNERLNSSELAELQTILEKLLD
jgi:hypothetical protein